VYVVEGEACFETPTRGIKLQKGETVALPTGTAMRALALGSVPRLFSGSSYTTQRNLPLCPLRWEQNHNSSRANSFGTLS